MTKWRPWAAGVGVLLLLTGLSFWCKQDAVTFQHLRDAQARLLSAGFHCTSDVQAGRIGTGFLISRDQVGWSDVATLPKSGVMGPRWQGKVWVTTNPDDLQLQTIPDDADTRVWGDVIAFGDAELLDELDHALSARNLF